MRERSAASLTDGTARYRRALVAIARRLADLHALRDGMDVEQAVDVLWFYFGYSGLFTLRERERLELRTRGTMARRTSDLGSTSKSPALLKVSESRRMRELFGAMCSPVRHICATTIDLENPRPCRSARNSTGEKHIGCAILLPASPREVSSHERIPAGFVERRVEADRAVWPSGKKAVTGERMRSRAPICASNYNFTRMRWAVSRSPPDVVIFVVVVIGSATAIGGAVSPEPLDHRSANLATHGGDDFDLSRPPRRELARDERRVRAQFRTPVCLSVRTLRPLVPMARTD